MIGPAATGAGAGAGGGGGGAGSTNPGLLIAGFNAPTM
jgi:hypothetical protein